MGSFHLLKGSVVGCNDGLIGILGLVDGIKNVFLLDSGASNNFMALDFVEKYGLKMQCENNSGKVRLANGKIIETVGVV